MNLSARSRWLMRLIGRSAMKILLLGICHVERFVGISGIMMDWNTLSQMESFFFFAAWELNCVEKEIKTN